MKLILAGLLSFFLVSGCVPGMGHLTSSQVMVRLTALEKTLPAVWVELGKQRRRVAEFWQVLFMLAFAGELAQKDVDALMPLVEPNEYHLQMAYVAILENRMDIAEKHLAIVVENLMQAEEYLIAKQMKKSGI